MPNDIITTQATSRNQILLPLILSVAQQLANECVSIQLNRTHRSRFTRIQRYLSHIAIPLQSLSARLRRGLVVGELSDQNSYTSFAHTTLIRFESDLLSLFRTLDNRARKTLVSLMEKASNAVVLIDEKDRALTLNALCCI